MSRLGFNQLSLSISAILNKIYKATAMDPVTFRLVAILMASALLCGASAAREASPDFVAFYPIAIGAAARPENEKDLRVLCEARLDGRAPPDYAGRWLSFLSSRTDFMLAAITKAQIKAPADVISLRPRFAPLPTALVTPASTLDWMYLYDRNGDGRVDYLVYLQNAHAVLPDPVPTDFPTPQLLVDGRIRVSKELAYAMIDHAQLVFRHYADDNFDGIVDAVVVEEFDKERPMFVSGYVAYSVARGDTAPRAWAFRNDISKGTRELTAGAGQVILLPTAEPGVLEPASARLAQGSRLLDLINRTLEGCSGAVRPVPAAPR